MCVRNLSIPSVSVVKSSFSFLILAISLVFFWIHLARGSSVWLFSSDQVLVSLTLLWVFSPLFSVQFLFLYWLFNAFFCFVLAFYVILLLILAFLSAQLGYLLLF